MVAKYFSCTFPLFKNATNLYLLGIMHAAPPLVKSRLTKEIKAHGGKQLHESECNSHEIIPSWYRDQ